MDKTGLRKGKPKKNVPLRPKAKKSEKPKMSEEEREKARHDAAVQMALEYGIGYQQYKKEVDSIRAQRIRERLENKE